MVERGMGNVGYQVQSVRDVDNLANGSGELGQVVKELVSLGPSRTAPYSM